MRIELLNPEQWRRYREIRLRALSDTPDAFARTYEEEKVFPEADWRRRLTSGAKTFVAVVDSKDVGLVTGGDWRDRDGVAGLFSMWVAPQARQNGVGITLVQSVVEWAKFAGFDQLVLDVADTNQPAICLYERAGFYRTGSIGCLPPPREHVTEHERSLKLREG